MALAVWEFGLLAIHSPFPLGMLIDHGALVTYASELICFVPIALLLGVIFWRLFSSRPVVDSFLSGMIALLVSFAGVWDDPDAAVGALKEMPQFWVTYVFGVPGVVYLLERLRSNYRLERP